MLLHNNSQCPSCHGMLKARYDMRLKCIDCKKVYEPYDEGVADKELKYKEADIKENGGS